MAATTNPAPAAAIFGAGPGLGYAAARFFGRQGHRVALVARNAERLDAAVKQLADEGDHRHRPRRRHRRARCVRPGGGSGRG